MPKKIDLELRARAVRRKMTTLPAMSVFACADDDGSLVRRRWICSSSSSRV